MTSNRFRRPRAVLAAALTASALLTAPAGAQAAPGDLDTSFAGGRAALGEDGRAFGVTVQPDGKVVSAGIAGSDAIVIARHNPDGTPDRSFSGDGRAGIDVGAPVKNVRQVAVQADGAIVAAGGIADVATQGAFDMLAVRLTPDGSIDRTFSGDGIQRVDFEGKDDGAANLVIQPDGRIVLGGHTSFEGRLTIGLLRLNPDGEVDKTYGTDGRVRFLFATSALANDIALDPEGGVVAAGSAGRHTVVARADADGQIDPNFGGNGARVVQVGDSDDARGLTVQPDGRIVTVGATSTGGGPLDTAVVRLTPQGELDPTFDGDGKRVLSFSDDSDLGTAAAVTPTGKVAVAAAVPLGGIVVASLNPDGSNDSAFGVDGHRGFNFGSPGLETADDVAVSGGRLYVAGVTGKPAAFSIVAVQIATPAPAPDTPPVEPAPAPAPRDTLKPVLSKLKLAKKRQTGRGSLRLSEKATVVLKLQVKKGRTFKAKKTVRLAGVAPGARAFKLGRLKRGTYRLTATATDDAGNVSRSVRVRIVVPRRAG